ATAAGVVAVVAPATVFRGAAAVGPFNNFQLGVAPEDGDGVAARSADFDIDTVNVVAAAANHARVGTTAALYGRLKIDNAYGSELLRLPVPLAAQFWNGNRYVANAADNCTPLAAANFNVAAGAGVAVATAIEAGATMVNGSGTNFRLARPNPTPAGKGSVRLSTSAAAPAAAPLNSYLPGIGGGTFGVYKSGPVIFTREMY
ncbi:MAG: hypothetical protein H7Z39_11460, partial [Burkholderiaceae bacterium]|nr:hypothetical protein [Burkholderiaceae bacterium]